jgi:hypothetical protein
MCDVPSVAVFCSESIECFPGKASKFFVKLFVTVPVALIINCIIVHFRFSIIVVIIIISIIIGSIRVLNQPSRLLHFVYYFSCLSCKCCVFV